MERKLFYEQPATEVVELRSEGVICTSDHNLTVTDPFDGLDEILW